MDGAMAPTRARGERQDDAEDRRQPGMPDAADRQRQNVADDDDAVAISANRTNP